jgi:hypothetical protein
MKSSNFSPKIITEYYLFLIVGDHRRTGCRRNFLDEILELFPIIITEYYLFLIVGEHIVEGLAQVVGTLFDLELLPVDLVLDIVDPLVQLGDVHLAVLEPALKEQCAQLLRELLKEQRQTLFEVLQRGSPFMVKILVVKEYQACCPRRFSFVYKYVPEIVFR